ncbi:hypothetical protein OIU93_07315 [Paeniglutamicibacter sp. ZC-3]|uniref:hypothetical protein n=1 Tax=Paeniglutamicibacter sp. ZC-3 TaxID=2986919 RepID=UPI0021F7168D|nr:hypothetical protein [Paeniglutamicibacter sp. ZC-3]MCV9994108.1 hypothetical protein [Paeniglutamicibacter sp. ZC-3]
MFLEDAQRVDDLRILDGAQGRQPCFPGPVGSCGDLHALLTQDGADRLDRMTFGMLLVNEPADRRRRGSSSLAKKIEAAFRISLASFRFRFSTRRRLSSSCSSAVGPSFRQAATWDCTTQRHNISPPTSSFGARALHAANTER